MCSYVKSRVTSEARRVELIRNWGRSDWGNDQPTLFQSCLDEARRCDVFHVPIRSPEIIFYWVQLEAFWYGCRIGTQAPKIQEKGFQIQCVQEHDGKTPQVDTSWRLQVNTLIKKMFGESQCVQASRDSTKSERKIKQTNRRKRRFRLGSKKLNNSTITKVPF